MHFGETIKQLRESKNLLQRQLAASLEIDTPMYSKIERGERKAKRDQVEKLAVLLQTDTRNLLTIWLADQVMDLLQQDELAMDAIKLAEKKFKTATKK